MFSNVPNQSRREKMGTHPEEHRIEKLDVNVGVAGESVSLNNLEDYFSEINPSGLTEAKIQRRVTVEKLKEKKRDYAFIILMLTIFLVGAAIALFILSKIGGGSVDPQAIANAIESGLARQTARVITQNATATGIG